MLNYKELYEHFEETKLHKQIPEVMEAEIALAELLNTISDQSLKEAVDSSAGRIARAYEMQGFSMGMGVISHSL